MPVWESHADSDVRRASKPGSDQTFPTYMVSGSDRGMDDLRMAAVSTQQSTLDQLEILLWRLLVGTAAPALPPKLSAAGNSDMEALLRNLLPGNLAPAPRSRLGPI